MFIASFLMSGDDEIKKFAETYHLTFPVGKDNGIARTMGVRGIPASVFVSKTGTIVKKHRGEIDYAEIVSFIEAALK